ncbi:MAG: fatty acid desaturase [Alphaproteobacteria bacterium]
MQAHDSNLQTLSAEDLHEHCEGYKGADTKRSISQLLTTFIFLALVCSLMLYGIQSSALWITGLLLLPAAGLLTRVFIFQHDCGHGSFFKSKKANDWTGRFLGLLTLTPYDFWRRAHNMHHATSGDLDRRSIGGIDTITVKEYRALPKWKQWGYRLYRNPVAMLIFGTPFYTIIGMRLPFNQSMGFFEGYKTLPKSSIWKSVMLTNVGLVVFYGALSFVIGWAPILTVYLPVLIVTTWIGGWLFYVQHQFEDAYWERNKDWDIYEASLRGSSYYALPPILQWFTGNIGLHHIHHLCLKIPNYKLQECLNALPELGKINKLTLRESLGCMGFKLWDEEQNKMVPFSHAHKEFAGA